MFNKRLVQKYVLFENPQESVGLCWPINIEQVYDDTVENCEIKLLYSCIHIAYISAAISPVPDPQPDNTRESPCSFSATLACHAFITILD